MALLYLAAGINHFVNQEFYLRIMPPWLQWHTELVIMSGICEILFSLLLIFPSTRRIGSWCIIGLLIAIFPANVQMMLNYFQESNKELWITILRLPLQIVLILWAYSFTKTTTRKSSHRKSMY